MRAPLHTDFAAVLNRAGVSQAAFARLGGVTARQVNNWTCGRAAVPRWAALLVIDLVDTTPDALLLMLNDAPLSCHQVLGVACGADMATLRQAAHGLALLTTPTGVASPSRWSSSTRPMRKSRRPSHERCNEADEGRPVAYPGSVQASLGINVSAGIVEGTRPAASYAG